MYLTCDLSPVITVMMMMRIKDEKFWAKVTKTDKCWLWIGCKTHNGYGQMRRNNKGILVHRYSYIMTKGDIPEGLVIDHLCRVRNCVNPDHLEAVTNAENLRRGIPGNKTHCLKGHEYNENNTAFYSGYKYCKTCNREKSRRIRASILTTPGIGR
jgi:hypothetical protein